MYIVNTKCSIPNCTRKITAYPIRKLCNLHYHRWWRCGDANVVVRDRHRGVRHVCIVPECGKFVVGFGYCKRHYAVWKRNGIPITERAKRLGKGYVNDSGYHLIRNNGKHIREHRFIMENHIGRPLLRSEIVHHKNGNRLDNRIENLEITTQESHAHFHHIGKPKPSHPAWNKGTKGICKAWNKGLKRTNLPPKELSDTKSSHLKLQLHNHLLS